MHDEDKLWKLWENENVKNETKLAPNSVTVNILEHNFSSFLCVYIYIYIISTNITKHTVLKLLFNHHLWAFHHIIKYSFEIWFFNDILAKASSIRVNIVVSGSAHRLPDSVISFTQSYQASIEVTSCCHMEQCWMPATATLQSLKSAVANLKSVLTVIRWIVMGFGAFAIYILC